MKKIIFTSIVSMLIIEIAIGQSVTLGPSSSNLQVKSNTYGYGNISTTTLDGADLNFRSAEPTLGTGSSGTLIGGIATYTNYFNIYSSNGKDLQLGVGGSGSSSLMIQNSTGYVGIGTTTPNAELQFANSTSNKKLVLYDSNDNQNQFYGFGVNASTLRYQVSFPGADHVFYAGTSAYNSNELMRVKGNGNVGIGTNNPTTMLDVNGSIKTRYSGTVITSPTGTGNQLFNLTIAALPAGWDFTNTVVLVSIADGGYGQIGQVKLLNATTIEVRENVQVGGATRYNYIVFKL